jgi:hypothetical protein
MSSSILWQEKARIGASRTEPAATVEAAGPVSRLHPLSARDDQSRASPKAFVTRFTVINLVGVALVAAAWAEGWALKPYQADSSGMCFLITALFLWGLWRTFRSDWQAVRWIGNTLVYLGMVGTVLGLVVTVSALSVDQVQSFESFKSIIEAIFIGSGTALYTNLLACVGYLWLGTNAQLLARQEI